MHPKFSHFVALLEEGIHGFGRGTKQQSRNAKENTCFTRFVINAFTSAASPNSRRHISLNSEPNSMILGLLESLGCLVFRESNFTTIGLADQKLWPKRVETTQNWPAVWYPILWAEVDQPNELQIKRGWSCWKDYCSSLINVRTISNLAHYILLQKHDKTGGICGWARCWLIRDLHGFLACEGSLLGLLKLLLTFFELNNSSRIYGHGAWCS